MIKEATPKWTRRLYHFIESMILPRRFKELKIHGIPRLPGHSILLLQNHFSWWDGFFGSYLCYEYFHKHYHVMVQEDQLRKFPFFRYKGAFSIRKNSREALESIAYAADLLNQPDHLVLMFPQGKLQSMHVTKIAFEKGVFRLMEQVQGPCQVIYCAVVLEYLESFKPTAHLHLLDLGKVGEIDPGQIQAQVSDFHGAALRKQVRE